MRKVEIRFTRRRYRDGRDAEISLIGSHVFQQRIDIRSNLIMGRYLQPFSNRVPEIDTESGEGVSLLKNPKRWKRLEISRGRPYHCGHDHDLIPYGQNIGPRLSLPLTPS